MFPHLIGPQDGWESHADLVEDLRAGGSSAHEWIAERYREPLIALGRSLLGGVGDAEDIVQEAFLRLWSGRKQLRVDGSIRALLYCTVRSLCIDELRRSQRRKSFRTLSDSIPGSHSPLEQLLGLELERLAEEAVHALPPRRKTVFQMVREEGMSHRDTAEALGVSVQTVANTMSSALAQIRTALATIMEDAG